MKKVIVLLSITLFLFNCKEATTPKTKILAKSSGKINVVSVVIDNQLWQGDVGEAVRDALATPVYGLPQDEPTFSMRQIPADAFKGFVTKNRTLLKVEKGPEAKTIYKDDVFSKPQQVVIISGKNDEEIINEIKTNADKIVAVFKAKELEEKQRQISKSLYKNSNLETNFGLTLNFPTAYKIIKNEDGFFRVKKELKTGFSNIIIYELPFNAIKRNDSLVQQIVKLRDSIGKVHIPGRVEGAYMITEKSYSPFVNETIVDNKPTIETRGLWDVKNDFMNGPFINYIIEDEINKRLVVVEGFAFAPSLSKREHAFELEAILNSIKIK